MRRCGCPGACRCCYGPGRAVAVVFCRRRAVLVPRVVVSLRPRGRGRRPRLVMFRVEAAPSGASV
eukprot:22881-Lingulodinium_polyedra.AAC.1